MRRSMLLGLLLTTGSTSALAFELSDVTSLDIGGTYFSSGNGRADTTPGDLGETRINTASDGVDRLAGQQRKSEPEVRIMRPDFGHGVQPSQADDEYILWR